uniref:Activating signal cointegrator 1 complex subunit 3-like n=1 Tax=Dermatophagoides pteronyssinus TaxID=6956 RepID=A0A6P6XKP9_DERPT|nr:activating signal cointegrator 1 complex subunit 3-like [Dermatophagoides pteronyssinus]
MVALLTPLKALVFEVCRKLTNYLSNTGMYSKLVDLVLHENVNDQMIIFVQSRKKTKSLAAELLKEIPEYLLQQNPPPSFLLKDIKENFLNYEAKLLLGGIGFHNASMDITQRKLVEKLFSENYIRILISTATLAWGVNLPAHTVIVYGSSVTDPDTYKLRRLSLSELLQMFGRAGRVDFNQSGSAYLISRLDDAKHYCNKLVKCDPIKSTFLKSLDAYLLAEIYLNNLKTLNQAVAWLKSTFYAASNTALSYDDFKQLILNSLSRLSSSLLIKISYGHQYEASAVAKVMVKYYLDIATFKLIGFASDPAANIKNLSVKQNEFVKDDDKYDKLFRFFPNADLKTLRDFVLKEMKPKKTTDLSSYNQSILALPYFFLKLELNNSSSEYKNSMSVQIVSTLNKSNHNRPVIIFVGPGDHRNSTKISM